MSSFYTQSAQDGKESETDNGYMSALREINFDSIKFWRSKVKVKGSLCSFLLCECDILRIFVIVFFFFGPLNRLDLEVIPQRSRSLGLMSLSFA